MKARTRALPNGRIWLRVADPDWDDPMDDQHAARTGGRWTPAGSYRTLYLNADVETAQLQIEAMLRGSPVQPEDLGDDAYVLAAATLPKGQTCTRALTDEDLRELGLPETYPMDAEGRFVPRTVCQSVGASMRNAGTRGIVCRSGATPDGRGRELAWFPATARSRAHPVWPEPLRYGAWRHVASWEGLELDDQALIG